MLLWCGYNSHHQTGPTHHAARQRHVIRQAAILTHTGSSRAAMTSSLVQMTNVPIATCSSTGPSNPLGMAKRPSYPHAVAAAAVKLSSQAYAPRCPLATCCLMTCMASSSILRARLFLPSLVMMPTSFSNSCLSDAVSGARCCCCCCWSAAASAAAVSKLRLFVMRDLNTTGWVRRWRKHQQWQKCRPK